MKTCLLCGTQSADDVATCPMDGEASWGKATADAPAEPVTEESEPAEAAEAADADAAADPSPKTKRARAR